MPDANAELRDYFAVHAGETDIAQFASGDWVEVPATPTAPAGLKWKSISREEARYRFADKMLAARSAPSEERAR